MRLKLFLYSTPLIKDFFVLFSSLKNKKNNFSYILSTQAISKDSETNNLLLNLWHNKQFLELASIFKEKPSLFIKPQRNIIFNHLINFMFLSREDFNAEHNISDKELFYFTLLTNSHSDIKKEFTNFLEEYFLKIDVFNSFSPYLLFLHPDYKFFEPFSDLKINRKDIFNDLNKIFSGFFNAIDNNDFYEIDRANNISIKFQPNTPYFSELNLFSFKSYVAIKTFSCAIENNIKNFSLTLPVPILISVAYLIHKEKNDPEFKITEKMMKKCFLANEVYCSKILKKSINNEVLFSNKTGQEYFDWHVIQSKNLKNNFNNNQDISPFYFQVLNKLKNENNLKNKQVELSHQEIIYKYLNEINNVETTHTVSIIINSINNIKKNVKLNPEISTYLEQLDSMIISILESYISCSSISNSDEMFEDMLHNPLETIKTSITSLLKNEQEQNIAEFIKTTKKINKIL